mgnify:CR=1 FL=1
MTINIGPHIRDRKNKIISTKFRGKYQFNLSKKKIREVDILILPSGKGIVKFDIDEFIVPNKKLNKAFENIVSPEKIFPPANVTNGITNKKANIFFLTFKFIVFIISN